MSHVGLQEAPRTGRECNIKETSPCRRFVEETRHPRRFDPFGSAICDLTVLVFLHCGIGAMRGTMVS